MRAQTGKFSSSFMTLESFTVANSTVSDPSADRGTDGSRPPESNSPPNTQLETPWSPPPLVAGSRQPILKDRLTTIQINPLAQSAIPPRENFMDRNIADMSKLFAIEYAKGNLVTAENLLITIIYMASMTNKREIAETARGLLKAEFGRKMKDFANDAARYD
jgi:hypothetical protein